MVEHYDSLKIDYHLSYYRVARQKLREGIDDDKERQRQIVNRDAAVCAIALEIGLIQEVGNCHLPIPIWLKTLEFIGIYERAEVAA
jgi:hypothetical protein